MEDNWKDLKDYVRELIRIQSERWISSLDESDRDRYYKEGKLDSTRHIWNMIKAFEDDEEKDGDH